MGKDITIEVVSGVEGPSLYINDRRVAGNKPWGGGRVLHKFTTTQEELDRALLKRSERTTRDPGNANG